MAKNIQNKMTHILEFFFTLLTHHVTPDPRQNNHVRFPTAYVILGKFHISPHFKLTGKANIYVKQHVKQQVLPEIRKVRAYVKNNLKLGWMEPKIRLNLT